MQRVQTYLYLSGFILLKHKAEYVSVRSSEQTQVERAVSNGEFLEEHCKQSEGSGVPLNREEKGGPGLGNAQVGADNRNGCEPAKTGSSEAGPSIPAWHSRGPASIYIIFQSKRGNGQTPHKDEEPRTQTMSFLSTEMDSGRRELPDEALCLFSCPDPMLGSPMDPNTM